MQINIPQNQANELVMAGGMVIVLELPRGSEFGIDMRAWIVGDKFMGVKMVPPGLHYVYATSGQQSGVTISLEEDKPQGEQTSIHPTTTAAASRRKCGASLGRGFWFYMFPQDVVVLKWDPQTESCVWIRAGREWIEDRIRVALARLDTQPTSKQDEMLRQQVVYMSRYLERLTTSKGQGRINHLLADSSEEADEHRRIAEAARKMQLDAHLGAYPLDAFNEWFSLVGQVTLSVFLECAPRLEDPSRMKADDTSSEQRLAEAKTGRDSTTNTRRETRFDRAERLAMLEPYDDASSSSTSSNESKSVESQVVGDLRLTLLHLPRVPVACQPDAITRLTLDRTVSALEWIDEVSARYSRLQDNAQLPVEGMIVQELQLSFSDMLIGQSYLAYEVWSRIIDAVANAERLLDPYLTVGTYDRYFATELKPREDLHRDSTAKSWAAAWDKLTSVQAIDEYLATLRGRIHSRFGCESGSPEVAVKFLSLYVSFVETLTVQITKQLPKDMFIDELGKESFFRPALKSLVKLFAEAYKAHNEEWTRSAKQSDDDSHESKERSEWDKRLRAQWLRAYVAVHNFQKELAVRPGWSQASTTTSKPAPHVDELDDEGDDVDDDVVIVDEAEARKYGLI